MLLLGKVVGAVPSGLLLCWINHLVGRQGGNKVGDVERGVEGWKKIKSRTFRIKVSRGRDDFRCAHHASTPKEGRNSILVARVVEGEWKTFSGTCSRVPYPYMESI